ncbi:MAG: DNRLRE domain-containing protein [Clostridia bacterium]|nr:DNRLRE domain-containing protein [Clostridia bacterium]
MKNVFVKGTRLLLVALLMAASLLACMLAASAEDLEWNLLTDTDSGYRIRHAHTPYKSGTEADGTPYMYNQNGKPNGMYIYDDQNILGSFSTFSLEGDFYFDSFPTGTRPERDAVHTPKTRPLSFLCWLYNDIETGTTTAFNALRIDDEGFLYTENDAAGKTDVQLETGKWYNIRCVFSPRNGASEIFINGEKALDFSFTRFEMTKHVSGGVRYFDGYYSYDVKMKNLIVKTNSEYTLSLSREKSAEYFGYQTTKPENGAFSARVLLSLDGLDYNRVGYEVIMLGYDADGALVSEGLSARSKVVYDCLLSSDGIFYTADEFGIPYMAALEIEDLPVEPTGDFFELVVRPYVLGMDGIRRYGLSTSLTYTYDFDEEGYPLLSKPQGKMITVEGTDDTYIYNNETTRAANYGSQAQLQVRNVGDESTLLYRAAYYKFTLSAEAVKALDSAASAKLCVYIQAMESNSSRKRYDMMIHATDTDWTESGLNYNNSATLAAPQEELYHGDFAVGSFSEFEILPYLKEQLPNEDGTLTVSFRFANEGHADALLAYFSAKESGNIPHIKIANSLYTVNLSPEKTFNHGYEPWGYAESLVDEWFDDLRDKVYTKDENGNLVYHDELGSFAPEGYNATVATGDFTREFKWKDGTVWSQNAATGYKEPDSAFSANKFGRTLATLGTSTANAFLSSEYAEKLTEYDIYGGIANAGFKGEATGYFHTEKIGERTYIIDPLGNPFFAMGANTVCIGDSFNHPGYSVAKYGDETGFYKGISKELKETGVNLVWVSPQADNDQLLRVKDGLSVVISVKGVGAYMAELGRSQVSEGLYPHNNTINVFDPDFVTTTFKKNAELIIEGSYSTLPRVFGYIADNELPSGVTLLERYLTLDTAEPTNAFSYATAWAWLARRMDTAYPTLDEYRSSPDKDAINSEFLSFMYARAYKVIGDSIRAVDPNHMYMGSRVHGICMTNEGYLRAAGQFLDILTLNLYGGLNPDAETISNLYKYSGKPFIVTEFFAKGMDAIDANGYKLANSTGAGILVDTQKDRADYYEHYALAMLEAKACVGWTWYRFRDNDQGLYQQVGTDRKLIMLYMYYGENPRPFTFMDVETGEILLASQVGEYTTVYRGEALASNQNVNKGLYNSDLSTTATEYTYDKSGKLLRSEAFEVRKHYDEEAMEGDLLISSDGKTAYIIGRRENDDGTYTETVMTTYEGRYVELTAAIRSIGDHLMGLVEYFDAN